MLKFQQQNAEISSVNNRVEIHGEDKIPACDIGIKVSTSAAVLDCFAPGLKDSMYAPPAASAQKRIRGTGKDDDAGPTLRFPALLGPLKIKKDWPGYHIKIDWGDLASSVSIALDDVRVTKFTAEPKDGGTCELSLQVQCHPSKEQYGEIAMLQQREVRVDLTPPTADEIKKREKEDAEKRDAAEGGDNEQSGGDDAGGK